MQKYLPSKQFVKTILVALALGVFVLLFGKIFTNKTVAENKQASKNISLNQKDGDFFSLDSDGDGLYDWEEALWGTNPLLKDSRGDGISDYDYVQARRKEIDTDETYRSNPNNETEAFAKQFYTTAAVLNQSGTFSQDSVEQFSQSFSQSISNFNIKDKYTLSDLKLSGVSAVEYHRKIAEIYASLSKPEVNELTLIAYILENPNDEFAMEELGIYLSFSQALINGLLSVNVPNSNAGLHLSYVNNLYKMSEIMRNVVYMDQDPLKFASYLSRYDEYSNRILADIKSFQQYFASNGII